MAREIQAAPHAESIIDASQARVNMRNKPVVLVTGGCGYIGSHTTLELMQAGWSVVVADNLANSNLEALYRVYYLMREYYLSQPSGPNAPEITSSSFPQLHFVQADVRDQASIELIFDAYNTNRPSKLRITAIGANRQSYRNASVAHPPVLGTPPSPSHVHPPSGSTGRITNVIHFAALKSVVESASRPLDYYACNVTGLINMLLAMDAYGVRNIVFSSSAVIYGAGNGEYISEDAVGTGGRGTGGGILTNPYGRTKWMGEEILNDWCCANPAARVIALRYFNPTGCHPSGLIGEDPNGTPNNLMPIVLQTYQRRRSQVRVFGHDYDTKDGSGVRDFIHVVDLARGHVAAINKLIQKSTLANRTSSVYAEISTPIEPEDNYSVYNLGTGTGYSVLEIIKAFGVQTGIEIPFSSQDRRAGDLGAVTANPTKAFRELGWQATHGLQQMCADLVKWADKNPQGYKRLRQLSVIAQQNGDAFANRVRKASVARAGSASNSMRNTPMPPSFGGTPLQPQIEEEEETSHAASRNLRSPLANIPITPDDLSNALVSDQNELAALLKDLVSDDELFGMVAVDQTTPEQPGSNPIFKWSSDRELSARGTEQSNSPDDGHDDCTSPRAQAGGLGGNSPVTEPPHSPQQNKSRHPVSPPSRELDNTSPGTGGRPMSPGALEASREYHVPITQRQQQLGELAQAYDAAESEDDSTETPRAAGFPSRMLADAASSHSGSSPASRLLANFADILSVGSKSPSPPPPAQSLPTTAHGNDATSAAATSPRKSFSMAQAEKSAQRGTPGSDSDVGVSPGARATTPRGSMHATSPRYASGSGAQEGPGGDYFSSGQGSRMNSDASSIGEVNTARSVGITSPGRAQLGMMSPGRRYIPTTDIAPVPSEPLTSPVPSTNGSFHSGKLASGVIDGRGGDDAMRRAVARDTWTTSSSSRGVTSSALSDVQELTDDGTDDDTEYDRGHAGGDPDDDADSFVSDATSRAFIHSEDEDDDDDGQAVTPRRTSHMEEVTGPSAITLAKLAGNATIMDALSWFDKPSVSVAKNVDSPVVDHVTTATTNMATIHSPKGNGYIPMSMVTQQQQRKDSRSLPADHSMSLNLARMDSPGSTGSRQSRRSMKDRLNRLGVSFG
ncbi:hypothetical protein PYCC9005_003087 [Savitreella phatthalungensis]